jgi:NADP-dependent 3-hydroxy acid dehydrogenase YdfG
MSGENLTPEGRVVMVSGANRGIGRAIAQELHGRGYVLSLGARDPDSLAPVLAQTDAARVMSHGFQARDPASAAPGWRIPFGSTIRTRPSSTRCGRST